MSKKIGSGINVEFGLGAHGAGKPHADVAPGKDLFPIGLSILKITLGRGEGACSDFATIQLDQHRLAQAIRGLLAVIHSRLQTLFHVCLASKGTLLGGSIHRGWADLEPIVLFKPFTGSAERMFDPEVRQSMVDRFRPTVMSDAQFVNQRF